MDLLKIFLVFIKSVIFSVTIYLLGFPDGSAVKESSCNVGVIGATVLIPGSGRSPGGRNGNSLQYSCLEIPWREEPGGLKPMGSQKVGHD